MGKASLKPLGLAFSCLPDCSKENENKTDCILVEKIYDNVNNMKYVRDEILSYLSLIH